MKKKTNYEGILRACEAALKDENGDRKVNLTCLWKYCSNEGDIIHAVALAQSAVENHFKGVKMQISFSPENDIIGSLSGELRPSVVEGWIRKNLTQKNKAIAFHNLQSFYKTEPRWLTQAKGFLSYVKDILRKICKEMDNAFTFNINKHKQKIIVRYT